MVDLAPYLGGAGVAAAAVGAVGAVLAMLAGTRLVRRSRGTGSALDGGQRLPDSPYQLVAWVVARTGRTLRFALLLALVVALLPGNRRRE